MLAVCSLVALMDWQKFGEFAVCMCFLFFVMDGFKHTEASRWSQGLRLLKMWLLTRNQCYCAKETQIASSEMCLKPFLRLKSFIICKSVATPFIE